MKQVFEIIAEHPFVTIFLAYCGAWIIQTIINAIKPCDCDCDCEEK